MTQLPLADPLLPPLLARGTVDRMSARRLDSSWLDLAWRDHGQVLTVSADGSARIYGDEVALAPAEGGRPAEAWFLGADAGTDGHDSIAPGGSAYFLLVGDVIGGRSLREVGHRLADRDAGLFATAVGLLNWQGGMVCCPRDGERLETTSAGWVRTCPRDGQSHFPRSDPAVIMLITSVDGEAAILGRQPGWPDRMFSCLAGFVEPGESAEQAVVRESREEAGLTVRDVRPVGSQPWPFPASLMLGFRAVADRDIEPAGVDGELADVGWFTRQDLREGVVQVPPATSIANWIIAGWLAEAG